MTARRAGLSSSCWTLVVAASCGPAWAQVAPESVLPGRPDAAIAARATALPAAPTTGPAVDLAGQVPLDAPFTSEAGGITIRPPAGGTMIRRANGTGDELVRFVNDDQKWRLVVSRVILGQPMALSAKLGNPAATRPTEGGFADSVAAQMPNETPGTLVRSELMPINGYDGAMLASRYRDATNATFLMQQAVVRRTDKTYYLVTYSTPLSSNVADVQADPLARRAVDAFERIIDSVQMVDQDQVAQDQADRLIRTRSLFVNWNAARLKSVIVPEQWLRLIKDGKDIGYTYVVEELANDVPRADRNRSDAVDPAKALGVRVGVRSRTMPEPGIVNDAQTWMWVNFDRGQESFSNVVYAKVDPAVARGPKGEPPAPLAAGAKPPEPVVDFSAERGTSIRRDRTVPQLVPGPGGLGNKIVEKRDDRYELQIWSTAKRVTLPPVTRELPPYYLPQVLGHLLPRLLPLSSPKTYLFASYLSDSRQVMLRYVDVLPATNIALAGQTYTAVPVQERIGIEGSVTTHYVTPEGKYLGSVNEDSKITIVATDAATLKAIWKDAALERPAEVKETNEPQASSPPTITREPTPTVPTR